MANTNTNNVNDKIQDYQSKLLDKLIETAVLPSNTLLGQQAEIFLSASRDITGHAVNIKEQEIDLFSRVRIKPFSNSVSTDAAASFVRTLNIENDAKFALHDEELRDGNISKAVKLNLEYEAVFDATATTAKRAVIGSHKCEMTRTIFVGLDRAKECVITRQHSNHKYETPDLSPAFENAKKIDSGGMEKTDMFVQLTCNYADDREILKRMLGEIKIKFFSYLSEESHMNYLTRLWLHYISISELEHAGKNSKPMLVPSSALTSVNFGFVGDTLINTMSNCAGRQALNCVSIIKPAVSHFLGQMMVGDVAYTMEVDIDGRRYRPATNLITMPSGQPLVICKNANEALVVAASGAEARDIAMNPVSVLAAINAYVGAMKLETTSNVAREVAVLLSGLHIIDGEQAFNQQVFMPEMNHVRDMIPVCVANLGVSLEAQTANNNKGANMILGPMFMREAVVSSIMHRASAFGLFKDWLALRARPLTNEQGEAYEMHAYVGKANETLVHKLTVQDMFDLDFVSMEVVDTGHFANSSEIWSIASLDHHPIKLAAWQKNYYNGCGTGLFSKNTIPVIGMMRGSENREYNKYLALLDTFGLYLNDDWTSCGATFCSIADLKHVDIGMSNRYFTNKDVFGIEYEVRMRRAEPDIIGTVGRKINVNKMWNINPNSSNNGDGNGRGGNKITKDGRIVMKPIEPKSRPEESQNEKTVIERLMDEIARMRHENAKLKNSRESSYSNHRNNNISKNYNNDNCNNTNDNMANNGDDEQRNGKGEQKMAEPINNYKQVAPQPKQESSTLQRLRELQNEKIKNKLKNNKGRDNNKSDTKDVKSKIDPNGQQTNVMGNQNEVEDVVRIESWNDFTAVANNDNILAGERRIAYTGGTTIAWTDVAQRRLGRISLGGANLLELVRTSRRGGTRFETHGPNYMSTTLPTARLWDELYVLVRNAHDTRPLVEVGTLLSNNGIAEYFRIGQEGNDVILALHNLPVIQTLVISHSIGNTVEAMTRALNVYNADIANWAEALAMVDANWVVTHDAAKDIVRIDAAKNGGKKETSKK